MATHKSAEKRHRQNVKRRDRNRATRATLRTAVKAAVTTAQAQDKKATEAALRASIKLIDKAAVHGILHKKNAARRISRLQKRVNALAKTAK